MDGRGVKAPQTDSAEGTGAILARILPRLEARPADTPVLIAGPTGAGKSALALAIAGAAGGEIINADALQVYSCWRVLTARPAPGEEARAPHHLYGHQPWEAEYSAGTWLREVAALLEDMRARRARAIIVGGTGLYFAALTEGLAEIPPVPAGIRARALARIAAGEVAEMVAELDPESRARIDTRNPMRVQRAWEVLAATGRGIAAWQERTPPPLLPPARALPLVLEAERAWLNARIDARFGAMMEAGALEEARALLPRWDPARPAARAIGAPALIAHLRGEITLEEAIAAARLQSRQYAKRQRSWFRSRMKGWHRIALP